MRQPIKFEKDVLSKYGIEWVVDCRGMGRYDKNVGEGKLLEYSLETEHLYGILVKESSKLGYSIELMTSTKGHDWCVNLIYTDWILSGSKILIDCEPFDTYEEAINALIQAVWGG